MHNMHWPAQFGAYLVDELTKVLQVSQSILLLCCWLGCLHNYFRNVLGSTVCLWFDRHRCWLGGRSTVALFNELCCDAGNTTTCWPHNANMSLPRRAAPACSTPKLGKLHLDCWSVAMCLQTRLLGLITLVSIFETVLTAHRNEES
jgi:hypothetical protein